MEYIGIELTIPSQQKPKSAFLMKNMVYCIICNILLVALVILTSCSRQVERVTIVPVPVHMEVEHGNFVITDNTIISIEDESQRPVAEWFAGLFRTPAGNMPVVTNNPAEAGIRLMCDPSLGSESYRLYVGRRGIDIHAADAAGAFYALQTVRQALPAALESDVPSPEVVWKVPSMTVYDSPRFPYRGLMVDVSRYFLPKDDLLEIIDCMAMLKLNNLHLHLTDDNGWRIEIRNYPLLTQIGAWRADRPDVPFPDRSNPVEGEPTPIGGYYSQDDIREIVAYAAERHVNVIPEIDIPAHSNSALAAYPDLACPVVDKFIGVLPGLGGRNADIIYCAGNDDVFEFLRNVLDEVCELFPSEYIHLGGDEAWKTYWKICPHCQERISDEELKDEEALQGWFMSQMNDYLKSKGRTMMCWDEVTNSRIPEDAVVFGWREDGAAALKAARLGHRFVMTPAEKLYLIRYQGPQWFEPLTYFGNSTLSDVYEYDPVQDCPAELESLLMGIQGSMWTEFCECPEDVAYQIFPRLAAVAENAWSSCGKSNWADFLRRMDGFLNRLEAKGVTYSKAMYNIQHEAVSDGEGTVAVTLQCERPDVVIRYTMDGSDPCADSPVYSGAISIGEAVMLKAATFFPDGSQAGTLLELPVGWSKATACRVMSGRPAANVLTNGVRGSLRQTDFEWCHFHDDAVIVVDLGQVSEIRQVVIGTLTNYGMAFNRPSSISLSLSVDGIDYVPACSCGWSDEEIFREGNFKDDVVFSFIPCPARYVKIKAVHPGVCPEGHIRSGQLSRFCFDEINVYGPPAYSGQNARKSTMFRPQQKQSSVMDKISDKSQKDFLRWSSLGGM